MKKSQLTDELKDLNFSKEEEFKIKLTNDQTNELIGSLEKLRRAMIR